MSRFAFWTSALLLVAIPACGGSDSSPSSGGSAGSDGGTLSSATGVLTFPMCTWPSGLDRLVEGQCFATRAELTCATPGATYQCPYDPSTDNCQGVSYDSCKAVCGASEYYVTCKHFTSGSAPTPPAGCRNVDGDAFLTDYCCPCE